MILRVNQETGSRDVSYNLTEFPWESIALQSRFLFRCVIRSRARAFIREMGNVAKGKGKNSKNNESESTWALGIT